MWRVLQLAPYRRLVVTSLLNELASSIGAVALALLVYRRTGSAIGATAFFLCAQFAPAILSPFFVARLEEALSAYREALKEYTRERVPLDWAATQANLGTALRRLGERESGTARLEEAVSAYRAARDGIAEADRIIVFGSFLTVAAAMSAEDRRVA